MLSRHMKKCEKRERDRERRWRNATKQGIFESSFAHIDHCHFEAMEESPSWLSDNGRGVEDIIAACDACYEQSHHSVMKDLARKHVKRIDKRLLPVLELVFENGKNRKESIWQLARGIASDAKSSADTKPQR